jgi:hypothetical protein
MALNVTAFSQFCQIASCHSGKPTAHFNITFLCYRVVCLLRMADAGFISPWSKFSICCAFNSALYKGVIPLSHVFQFLHIRTKLFQTSLRNVHALAGLQHCCHINNNAVLTSDRPLRML